VSNVVINSKEVAFKYSDKVDEKSNESVLPKQTTSSLIYRGPNKLIKKRSSRIPEIPIPKFDGKLKN